MFGDIARYMANIQIDIPDEINDLLKIRKIEKGFNTLKETALDIISQELNPRGDDGAGRSAEES